MRWLSDRDACCQARWPKFNPTQWKERINSRKLSPDIYKGTVARMETSDDSNFSYYISYQLLMFLISNASLELRPLLPRYAVQYISSHCTSVPTTLSLAWLPQVSDQPGLHSQHHARRKKVLHFKKCFKQTTKDTSLTTWVGSLGAIWWKERADSRRLSSDRCMHTWNDNQFPKLTKTKQNPIPAGSTLPNPF